VFDEVYILFHFNIILKHNGIPSTNIANVCLQSEHDIEIHISNLIGLYDCISFFFVSLISFASLDLELLHSSVCLLLV